MTETKLSELTGIAQPQISKLLSGMRKRWSAPIAELCQYAKISIPVASSPSAADQRLSRALRQALGNHDDPRAAEILARVIEALAPAMTALCAAPSSESSNDHGK